MIKKENYPNAFKEVYVILNTMNKKEVELISDSYMEMIKKNMNNNYNFSLDKNIEFSKQNILQETKVILADIFLKFWANSQQKERIEAKFKNDLMIEEINKNYNPDEIFKYKSLEENNIAKIQKETENNNKELIEYKKENIFLRMVKKIKSIFKK